MSNKVSKNLKMRKAIIESEIVIRNYYRLLSVKTLFNMVRKSSLSAFMPKRQELPVLLSLKKGNGRTTHWLFFLVWAIRTGRRLRIFVFIPYEKFLDHDASRFSVYTSPLISTDYCIIQEPIRNEQISEEISESKKENILIAVNRLLNMSVYQSMVQKSNP